MKRSLEKIENKMSTLKRDKKKILKKINTKNHDAIRGILRTFKKKKRSLKRSEKNEVLRQIRILEEIYAIRVF